MNRFAPFLLASLAGLAACSDRTPTRSADVSAPTAPASFDASAAEAPEFVPGQVIVRFRPGANRAEVAQANGARHGRDMRLERTVVLEVAEGEELEVVSRLRRNPNVEFAEPDYIYRVGPCEVAAACELPDGQFFHYKWDLQNRGTIQDAVLGWGTVASGTPGADIKWGDAYDHLGAGFSGSAVIAILDTGIRPTHQAFAGKILGGRRFVTGVVTNYTDDHGHGTHVAAIAAARGNAAVPGVAYSPNVKILVGKVCNSAGSCPSSGTADAIVWAADNGANVINMSLGSPGWTPDGGGSLAQQAALQYANSKNVISFCATGNDHGKPEYNNVSGGIGYPARFPECVAVGSTNWNDVKASYSNFGPQIEIAAPGGDGNPQGHAFSQILAAGHTSDTGYRWTAGTSMATPQVAGLAALLWATGLQDAQAIRERLKETADDVEAAGWDVRTGAGRINAYRALTGLDTKAPPVANPGAGYTGSKGVPVHFDGTESFDPNGRPVTFSWSFGDGATATGATPSHTYLRAGTYAVTLTVTDASGLVHTATTQAVIPNVSPAVSAFAGATILRGETYAATGSFADPDPDQWTATVSYGDGSGTMPLSLSGQSFSLSRTYAQAGTYTVSVTVRDDDGGAGSRTATVVVLSSQQGVEALIARVGGAPLASPLSAAADALARGNTTAAANQLRAFIHQVEARVQTGRMSGAEGAELIAEAERILASIAAS